MIKLVFHHDHNLLPAAGEHLLPVQLYGLSGKDRGDISYIGNPVIDKVKRLGVGISEQAMDFLTIALSVTAADTFVERSRTEDGWTRQLSIELPLHNPERWSPIKEDLEKALHFLSGDIWEFDFKAGGLPPPKPYLKKHGYKLTEFKEADSVCLFSGGLDSAIGAIDLLEVDRNPLLVSHAYSKDKSHQNKVASKLRGPYSRFEANADPHHYAGITDITMRTRSLNFLAFAAVAASAVQVDSQLKKVELFVPENGFISLNAPLTPRRIGTLSTRTTHPFFLGKIQSIFDSADIRCAIKNPYQFKTKGQMVQECKSQTLIAQIVDMTVSCSHWKRPNKQCGVCVPCIIRRAALHAGKINDNVDYKFNDFNDVQSKADQRDDLMALSIAIEQLKTRNIAAWIADSGPLPQLQFNDFIDIFSNGLDEVDSFLKFKGVL